MDLVVVYPPHLGSRPQRFPAHPHLITREWLQKHLDQASQLEAMPCEEDALTDENYQPLFYLVVNAEGYTRNLPRNWNVESLLPDTVAIHTHCPTPDHPRAYVGLFGPAVLLPRALVPPEALPRWKKLEHRAG